MTEGGSPNLTDTEGDSDSVDQIYNISAMISLIIVSVKVALITSSHLYETKVMVQDVLQYNTFQLKGHHSTVSPEELSERWQIGLKQAREKIAKTTQRLTFSALMTLAIRYKLDIVFHTKRLTGMSDIDTMDG